jgi:prophage tail gpP-like protein
MATFKVSGTEVDDAVRIILGEQECLMVEQYEISIAYMQVPNAFSITVGSGETALAIMQRFPKNTRFRCMIGPVTVFSGRTDGFRRANAGATQILLSGRDAMAKLVRAHIEEDHNLTQATYEELARHAIQGAGISGYSLTFDTAAQRAAVTGTPIVETSTIKVPVSANDLLGLSVDSAKGQDLNFAPLAITPPLIERTITKITGFRSDNPIQAKAGTTWFEWVRQQLEKGGIFLRAGVDPDGIDEFVFVIGSPSADQPALYTLINARGGFDGKNVVNVLQPQFNDVAIARAGRYIVFGSKGSGKDGRSKVVGVYEDPEMIAAGYTEAHVQQVPTVKSAEHATFLARKNAATLRRQERSLIYPVPNRHTAPLGRDPTQRAVFAPDTVVHLKDDEHGIESDFWVERASFKGDANNGRMTELALMWPEDLIYGEGGFGSTKKPGRHTGRKVFGKTVAVETLPAVSKS